MRLITACALTFVVLLAGLSLGLDWLGHSHYLPQQQMDAALAAGDGCFLFLGDSRMAAAIDADAVHIALRRQESDRCLAPMAIGAVDISGIYVAAREYLIHGRIPRAAIIGAVGDSLLGPAVPLRPDELVGNNAIHLTWSEPGDVYAEVPGFPFGTVTAFDDGLRFLVASSMALGRYQSLVSAKIQHLQVRLAGENRALQNRFGALGDMARLEDGLRARAPIRLWEAMRGTESSRYGSWFQRLVELLHRFNVPMVVVELPMHRIYRTAVTDTPQGLAYQHWLAQELRGEGGSLLDLSRASWVDDRLFMDELHLGSAGAELASTEMGNYLAAAFRSSSR